MDELIRSLKHAGIKPLILNDRILCSPFGGRVLGLFPDDEHNLLWASDELFTDAAGFISQEDWRNIGGDRMWLAPEVSFNGDPNAWQSYLIQATIDPGEYQITGSSNSTASLQARLEPLFLPTKTTISLLINKEIRAIDNKPGGIPAGVQTAGYELVTSMSADGALPEAALPAIWNVLQVPGGGRVIAPTSAKADVLPFIGMPIVDIFGDRLEIPGSTEASFKCGIHKDISPGVMMYRRGLKNGSDSLVVREFEIDADGVYADTPVGAPQESGYIVQFYVDDGGFGGYVELEYHAPSVSAAQPSVSDRSTVWGFIGSSAEIDQVIQLYMGNT